MRGHSPLSGRQIPHQEWGEIEISTSSLEEHGAGGGLSKIEWKKQPNSTNFNQLIQSIYPSLILDVLFWRAKISRLIVPHPIKLIMKMRVLVYRRERLIFELFGEITR